MVVESRLMMQLIEEIKRALGVDTEKVAGASDLQVCLLNLELLGMLSFDVREWMGDLRQLLLELEKILGEMKEVKLKEKVREIMQMI
jgi:hypothetical protein